MLNFYNIESVKLARNSKCLKYIKSIIFTILLFFFISSID